MYIEHHYLDPGFQMVIWYPDLSDSSPAQPTRRS